MGPGHIALLVGAGLLAGAINSVAGGGSFLTYPVLLSLGVHPLQANATSTVSLWPGSVASAAGYWRVLPWGRSGLAALLGVSAVGGALGAWLLVRTPAETFVYVLPWLLLLAATIFTFGDRLRQWVGAKDAQLGVPAVLTLQLVLSIYGGYFGGGMGLVMLAVFTLWGMRDIHAMNGLKSSLALVLNGVAALLFLWQGAAHPFASGWLALGAAAGGFAGATLAQKVNGARVRQLTGTFGWLVTTYFFARTYGPW